MMLERITLRSAMIVRSMILACSALLSSSVLWRTLHWELKDAKRKLFGGVERICGDQLFIGPVGSPSGRCINVVWARTTSEPCGQVTRIRMSILTVRPLVAARVRT